MNDQGQDGRGKVERKIDATFRNGSVAAISVVLGFSLSFLNRWAALPGAWTRLDLVAIAAISGGTILQIVSVALLLPLGSLALRRYDRAVRIFLIGLVVVAIGVAVAIAGDILGASPNVLRG